MVTLGKQVDQEGEVIALFLLMFDKSSTALVRLTTYYCRRDVHIRNAPPSDARAIITFGERMMKRRESRVNILAVRFDEILKLN
jgi:hypothetical protein